MSYDVRNIDAELAACDLKFAEQCRIVAAGIKRGVRYDGCSGVPDFDFGTDCCGEHDVHYQLGDVPRAEADRRLYACILKKGIPSRIGPLPYNSNWLVASCYWFGVRVLGWKFYRSKKHESKRKLQVPDVDRDIAGP